MNGESKWFFLVKLPLGRLKKLHGKFLDVNISYACRRLRNPRPPICYLEFLV